MPRVVDGLAARHSKAKLKQQQRNVRYFDPGVTPMGRPKPLPVGEITVGKMTRQLRRALARKGDKR
jgi:hypothetical protein